MTSKELQAGWQSYDKEAAANNCGLEQNIQNAAKGYPIELINEALIFWAYLRGRLSDYYGASEGFWNEWGIFLRDFQRNANPYIELIAYLEFLPTTVWRKILWKHNIDFMDFGAFLRRITVDQQLAIIENCQDIMSGQLPRVFSWWDKKIKKVTVDSLWHERLDKWIRYQSKGEMSYNLLGIDFGFNAYPLGIKDDTKVVEVSPFRFISEKQHADDFVVNTEDGKYWKMYKFARSNFVYRPNRDVELNTHICPGFWYTLIMHILFFIISPLMAFSAAGSLMDGGFQWTNEFILPSLNGWWPWHWSLGFGVKALIGAFTTVWVVLALLKLLWFGIKAGVSKIAEVWDDDSPFVYIPILIIFFALVLFVSAATSGFLWTFSLVAFFRTILNFGIFILLIDLNAIKDDRLKRIARVMVFMSLLSFIPEFPNEILGTILKVILVIGAIIVFLLKWLIVSIPATFIWLLVNIPIAFWWFIDLCVSIGQWIYDVMLPAIGSFFASLVETILMFFAAFGIISIAMVLCLLIPIGTFWLLAKMEEWGKSEKVMTAMAKYGRWLMNFLLLTSSGVLIYLLFFQSTTSTVQHYTDSIWPTVIRAIFGVTILLTIFGRFYLYKYDGKFRKFMDYLSGRYDGWNSNKFAAMKSWWALSKNKEFIKTPEETRQQIIESIYNLVFNEYLFRFTTSSNHREIFKICLNEIYSKSFVDELEQRFDKDREKLKTQMSKIWQGGELRYFLLLAQRESFVDALKVVMKIIKQKEKEAKKMETQRSKQKERFILTVKKIGMAFWNPIIEALQISFEVLKFMFWLIGKILYGIVWPFIKLYNGLKTLYKLWDLFQKRCPWVSQPKNLLYK